MRLLLLTFVLSLVGCGASFIADAPRPNISATASPNVSPILNGVCENLDSLEVRTKEEANRTVSVTLDGTLIKAIDVPRQIVSGVMGFSLNWAKTTKEGFEISIEYGSRYYFDKRLIFECIKDGFYLTKIHVESFDKHNPSKWTNKTIAVKPAVSLSKFDVMDYTN